MNASRRLWVQQVLLGALCAPLCAAATSVYESAGPYRADLHDLRWTDVERSRTLPLRLRLPDAPGQRPVILFSHGLGGSVDGGRFWGEHWASHGFLVIHIQHPGSDASVWREASRPAMALEQAADLEQFIARVRDVQYVLDELARRQRAGDALAARADLARIGMSGHSFGAITTQAIAGQDYEVPARLAQRLGPTADPRPRAFVAFSPSARSRQQLGQFAAITRPFFGVTGTRDGLVGMGLGVPAGQRLLPFEGMPPDDKYLLNLTGADHMVFNGGPRWRVEGSDPQLDALHVRLVQETTTAFWRAYLLDDRNALAWLQALDSAVGGQGRFLRK